MHRTLLMESIAALRLDYESRERTRKELHHRARELGNSGNLQQAAILYEQFLELDSANAEAWAEAGLIRHSLGDSEQALKSILKALSLSPWNARIHQAFGIAYRASASPA